MSAPKELLRPSYNSDGSVAFTSNAPHELQRKIQEGDPTIGWEGDILLGLFHDKRPGGIWWVYEAQPNRRPKLIYGTDVPDERILHKLRDMRNNAKDLMGTVRRAEAHDAKVERERAEAQSQHWQETLDRIASVVNKEKLA